MIKICSESVTIPLKIIFEESLKKVNVVLINKKEDKTLIKNYRPISLIPIFGKIFERVIERVIYNSLLIIF